MGKIKERFMPHTTKSIALEPGADPEAVLAVARGVAVEAGYLWEATDPTSALVSEGGKPVRHRWFAWRLAATLTVIDDDLRVAPKTTGLEYGGTEGGAAFSVRIERQRHKLVTALTERLSAEGLAS